MIYNKFLVNGRKLTNLYVQAMLTTSGEIRTNS